MTRPDPPVRALLTAAFAAVLLVAAPAAASSTPAGAGGRVAVGAAPAAPVITAAGDIACDPDQTAYNNGNGTSKQCRQKATSDLILSNPSIAAVLALGDNQNDCGGYAAYQQAFDPSWGRFKSIIHPVPGNHEYQTSGGTDCTPGDAAGYFRYFGAAAGDSHGDDAWNLGSWHLIALNGNCSHAGGCSKTSAQGAFLRANLGTSACTLAYWHQPEYSGANTGSTAYRYFWQTLYGAGAEIVLGGHTHTYARFAPQNASGAVDRARGIRQFIVGTGGDNLFSLKGTRNVEFTTKAFGALELTLNPTSYSWKFVGIDGRTIDSGTTACH